MAEALNSVIRILKKGGVIIYPTETAYALGCDATNKKAIKRIYKIKRRATNKSLTAIVYDLDMAKKYGQINKSAEKLIKKFMPGPLTLIVKKKAMVPDEFNPLNFGFRISDNKIASRLTKLLGKPITATSANLSGNNPEYSSKRLAGLFGNKVDAVIDAGELPKRKVSTVIDLTSGIKIIREGAISLRRILKVI